MELAALSIPQWSQKAFFFLRLVLFYVYECFPYMYVCPPCVCPVPEEAREGVGASRSIVTDGCKLPLECWNQTNPSPLEEQPVLLTTEPFHQPLWNAFCGGYLGFSAKVLKELL